LSCVCVSLIRSNKRTLCSATCTSDLYVCIKGVDCPLDFQYITSVSIYRVRKTTHSSDRLLPCRRIISYQLRGKPGVTFARELYSIPSAWRHWLVPPNDRLIPSATETASCHGILITIVSCWRPMWPRELRWADCTLLTGAVSMKSRAICPARLVRQKLQELCIHRRSTTDILVHMPSQEANSTSSMLCKLSNIKTLHVVPRTGRHFDPEVVSISSHRDQRQPTSHLVSAPDAPDAS
jgi:hypothetical protein